MVEPNPSLPPTRPLPTAPLALPGAQAPMPGVPAPLPGAEAAGVWGASALVPVSAPYLASDGVVAQIGDLQVTATTVFTPVGQCPLRGSRWDVTDQWRTDRKIPAWAIVLAIAAFFCVGPFSLLFLLAKTTVYHGVAQVRVSNGPFVHVARIPVTDQALVQHVYNQVNYVRSLSVF
jgi:hypothetical protein